MANKKKKMTSSRTSTTFFSILWQYYECNRKEIWKSYTKVTKKLLTFNDGDNGKCFLRKPQFQAFEMYVFLKEYLDTKRVHEIFDDWHSGEQSEKFNLRTFYRTEGEQQSLLQNMLFETEDEYKELFKQMKERQKDYANYIFALTMGTGKTILMALCIFYEFLLASKYPKDKRFCQNAVVFAPDKTVLQALHEIETFDMGKVIPDVYANELRSKITFEFLDDTNMNITAPQFSKYNIIISNAQKIIVKNRQAEQVPMKKFFKTKSSRFRELNEELFDAEGEEDLIPNCRFQKLARLPQLGIYVDEAHHTLGNTLKKSLEGNDDNCLRRTIDMLADDLNKMGSKVVGCYNFTGTPYINNQIMPEVVYSYGLEEAIKNRYLKSALPMEFSEVRDQQFIETVVSDFWEKEGKRRIEGMLPKLAIFAPSIDDLQKKLKPLLEKTLAKLGVENIQDKILVNVGDSKITRDDDIREFNALDTPESEKQFILLVGKGNEGWNCRSLFGVALFRDTYSSIFVLQSTMRCLRAIGPSQETGHIYLSERNKGYLDLELRRNYNITLDAITVNDSRHSYTVKQVPPPVSIILNRVRTEYKLEKNKNISQIKFDLDTSDYDKYKVVVTVYRSLTSSDIKSTEEIVAEQRRFTAYTLVAEISRYFDSEEVSCFEIEDLLENSAEGMDKIVEVVNQYNQVLFDVLIPKLFYAIYTLHKTEREDKQEVYLSSIPEGGIDFRCKDDLVVSLNDPDVKKFQTKSFNLDTYCFASKPEKDFFKKTLKLPEIEKIYFTGMLTHGQSDFYISYIDPETNQLRNYYPDFLVKTIDKKWFIIEVKGDNMIDDPIVQAKKKYAEKLLSDSNFIYEMIKSTDAERNGWGAIVNQDIKIL